MKYLLVLTTLVLTTKGLTQNIAATCRSIDIKTESIIRNLKIWKQRTDRDGQRILYTFENYSVIKVHTTENNLIKDVSWFFENDSLFFCDQKWQEIMVNKLISHEKFYLQQANLIYWAKNDSISVIENSLEFSEMKKELPAFANRFLNLLK